MKRYKNVDAAKNVPDQELATQLEEAEMELAQAEEL